MILLHNNIKVKEEPASEAMDQVQVKTEPVEDSYETVNIKQEVRWCRSDVIIEQDVEDSDFVATFAEVPNDGQWSECYCNILKH